MSSRQSGIVLILATLLGGGVARSEALASPAIAGADASALIAQADSTATASASTATAATSQANPALAATTTPPWNPPKPIPAERAWETALRFPGRIVSLPIQALGIATEKTMLWAEDHFVLPRVMAFFHAPSVVGVYLRPASLGDRTGLGIRTTFAPPRIGKYVSADWEGSTRKYSRATLRAGYGPAWVEFQNDWRPQERFFGLGLESSENDDTNFASETKSLMLNVGTNVLSRRKGLLYANAWVGERYRVTRGGKESGGRSFEEVFPSLGALIDLEQDYRVGGASITFDNRGGKPHWTHGARLVVAGEKLSDTGDDLAFSGSGVESEFTRLIVEGETGVSFFMSDPRTIRLYGTVVDQEVDKGAILLADLSHLGGSAGLAGFEPRRFHDIDMAVVRLTYIFGIGKHVELDLHAEAGGVYGDVWQDATMSSLKNSYGIALRPRASDGVIGRIGVDWSKETVRIRYTLGAIE